MWKWITATEERRAAYELARQTRADYRFELIDGIVAKLNAGTIEPANAREMIQAIKWQASKENPKSYGDKVEYSGSIGVSFSKIIEELDGTAGRLPKDKGSIELVAVEVEQPLLHNGQARS
jgi:hypothetical protein